MKLSFKALKTFSINTKDKSDVAKVEDFLVDQRDHVIRYIVARIGSWPLREKYLLSPTLIKFIRLEARELDADISSHTLKSCPLRGKVKTVTDQLMAKMDKYYNFPVFSAAYSAWGYVPKSRFYSIPKPSGEKKGEVLSDLSVESSGASNIRSLEEMDGYSVFSSEENKVGKISDFVVDVDNGSLDYFVITTGKWLKSKRFLVVNEEVNYINSKSQSMIVSMTKSQIERCPPYSEKTPINAEVGTQLYDYFGRSQQNLAHGSKIPLDIGGTEEETIALH